MPLSPPKSPAQRRLPGGWHLNRFERRQGKAGEDPARDQAHEPEHGWRPDTDIACAETIRAVGEAEDTDVTRRTMLAAERTWLAWWRSGIAAATASVAVGGVVPEFVGGDRWPYVVVGAGYALLAMALFIGAWLREREVGNALDRGGYVGVNQTWVVALSAAAALLSLGTLIVIIAQA
jgi:putative membrane protein